MRQWERELTDLVEKCAGNGLGLGIALWAELGLALMPWYRPGTRLVQHRGFPWKRAVLQSLPGPNKSCRC